VADRLPATDVIVRVVAAGCQAATIAVTWRLWESRTFPPNLPVVGLLGGVDYALALLVLSLACIVIPRFATPAFLVVLLAAVLGDQTRIQPEVISLALLMALPLYGPNGIRVARWHLTALWLWSGLNKALSSGWSHGAASFIATSLHASALRPVVAIALPAAEITLALTSLWPRAWSVTRWGAVAVHVGIFLTLSPLFAGWNSSVWAWNIALAVAGFLLFDPAYVREGKQSPYVGVAAAVFLVTPALFYAGITDAYLSHNLYTTNTAVAQVCGGDGSCSDPIVDTYSVLNVPLPPEERLYRAQFDALCRAGMQLQVTGPATVFSDPPTHKTFSCPRRSF
jgi:hypothetical protein